MGPKINSVLMNTDIEQVPVLILLLRILLFPGTENLNIVEARKGEEKQSTGSHMVILEKRNNQEKD